MINHWTELVTLRFTILRSMGTRLKTHAGDDFISMPPGLCFAVHGSHRARRITNTWLNIRKLYWPITSRTVPTPQEYLHWIGRVGCWPRWLNGDFSWRARPDLWGPGVRIPVDYQCVSRGFKHPADLSSFFLSVLVIDKYLVCRLCSGFSRLKMPPTSLCIPGAMQCGPDPKGVSAGQNF